MKNLILILILISHSLSDIHSQRRSFPDNWDSGYVHRFDSLIISDTLVHTMELSHDSILSLPLDFSRFSKLKRLSIIYFDLVKFPVALKNMSSIEVLLIGGNRIEKIPRYIETMTKLKELNMNGNRLRNLPSSMANLPYLHWLSLEDNLFQHVPKVLYQMKSLKFINLSGNKIPQSEIDELRKKRPDLYIVFDKSDSPIPKKN